MIGAEGEALYVGKAGDLKKARLVLFPKNTARTAHRMMLSQVAAVRSTVTRSEAEALILENNLIKSLSPRYNILFRDDKSYPYLMVSRRGFPQARLSPRGDGQGPSLLRSVSARGRGARDIQLLQECVRLRTCEDFGLPEPLAPCLLYQTDAAPRLRRPLSARPAYAEDVKSAQLTVEGRSDTALKRLEVRMQQHPTRDATRGGDLPRPDPIPRQGQPASTSRYRRGRRVDINRRRHGAPFRLRQPE